MKSSKPLVSIGLATRDRANVLTEAMDSLLGQTYKNIELIISDHASVDASEKICRQYQKKDPRVRYYKQSPHITAVQNFNTTLKLAKGEYFMWAADDDLWDERYIETMLDLLNKNPKAIVAVSNLTHFKDSYVRNVPPHNMKNTATQLDCIIHFMLTSRGFYFYGLYKTNVLKKINGYHSDFRPFFQGSDHLTIFKALLYGKMAFTDEVLYSQRDSGYHFQRYQVFKNLTFNKQIFQRILRYAMQIFFHILDLMYGIYYTMTSQLSFKDKCIVFLYVWIHFFIHLKEYTFTIIRGIYSFMYGIIKKILVMTNV